MPPPDAAVVQAAIAALRSDATKWESIAGEVRAAAAAAATLQLSGLHFSYVAHTLGMTRLYQAVQERMVMLLREAAETHDELANRLRLTADGYEDADEAAERAVRGIY